MGKDAGVDAVMAGAIETLKKLGATIVDVKYPDYLLASKQGVYNLLVSSEFKAQITDYLQTTGAGYPKSFDEVVARSNDPATKFRAPEKAYALKYTATQALDLDDPSYLVAKNEVLAATTDAIVALFDKHRPRRDRLSDVAATGNTHRAGRAAEARRRRRLAGELREPNRLPRPHRARRHDARGPAGHDLVLRPRVERAEAARLRLRLRASDGRSAPAETHAGATERHARVLTNRRAGTARAVPNGAARAFDFRGLTRARGAPGFVHRDDGRHGVLGVSGGLRRCHCVAFS